MIFSKKQLILVKIILAFSIIIAVLTGAIFGVIFAETKNISNSNKIGDYKPSLPSQILDINGELITEFFSDEKKGNNPCK